MTKALGIVAVLVAATTAFAAEPSGFGFDVAAADVMNDGSATTVYLTSVGAGTVGGMMANVQVSGPFAITSTEIVNFEGGFFTNPGNSAGEVNDSSSGFMATLWVFGATGAIAVPDGAKLAKITIVANPGAELNATGAISTTTDYGASTWDTMAPVGQGITALKVIPEPAAALLLLAGLPMLRRRRA